MDEITFDTVYKNMKPLLSEDGHVKKVTKETRQTALNSASASEVSPLEHSQAMAIIKDYHKESIKLSP
jgi:Fe2+ or Zn2+ uptake regulation protein